MTPIHSIRDESEDLWPLLPRDSFKVAYRANRLGQEYESLNDAIPVHIWRNAALALVNHRMIDVSTPEGKLAAARRNLHSGTLPRDAPYYRVSARDWLRLYREQRQQLGPKGLP